MMSESENVDVILGNYPENDFTTEPENDQNDVSDSLGEDFSSLLISNIRGNSDISVETARIVKEELKSLMARQLEEVKMGLNSWILAAINTAKPEKVILRVAL